MKQSPTRLALVASVLMLTSAKIGAQCTYPSPMAQGASINCGQTATLMASGSGPNIAWYDQATGGTLLGTGSNFTTPVLINSKTYYVETNDLLADSAIFSGTKMQEFWVVPPNVYSIKVDMAGAQGENTTYSQGGLGGRVVATLNVTPGETLIVNVGTQSPATAGTIGGYNGGGSVLYTGTLSSFLRGGGGASDIRKNGVTINDRILVAGGGGGAGYNSNNSCNGGNGGGLTAVAGYYNGAFNTTYSGQAGTQLAGGAAATNNANATAGSFFLGGRGYSASPTSYSGGGGGGGYYGGGGGVNYGGGGGGSSFADLTYASNVQHTQGFKTGDGYIKISYSQITCMSARVPVDVTVNTVVLLPQVQGLQVFCGFNATITASGSTGRYQWFTSPYSSTPVDTGAALNLGNVFSNTIMYVRAVDNYTNPLCVSAMVAVQVTTQEIQVPNTPPVVSVPCGDPATLTASGSSSMYLWYDQAVGGNLVGKAAAYTTPNLYQDTTYYWVEAVSDTLLTDSLIFNYTGGIQYFTVPAGVSTLEVKVFGAQGGSTTYSQGGLGGYVSAKIPVTSGQILNLFVGEQPTAYLGGWNGGGQVSSSGTYSRGGGGASDIRVGGIALSNRVIVAGAGGGAGYYSSNTYTGGAGGGLTAGNGTGSNFGSGGSQTSGGSSSHVAGSLGIGGTGYLYGTSYVGGGGGGGYYGGGGGYSNCCYSASGGGGGSSYTIPTATNVIHTQGANNGHGKIVVKFSKQYCSSTRKKVAAVTNAIPVPTAVHDAILCGEDAELGVTGSNGKYFWYADPNGAPIATGNTFRINRLKNDTTLWVAATSDTVSSSSHTFNYTGSVQTFTVPAGVTSIEVEMAGAQGGNYNFSASGGLGAVIKSSIAVTPGQVLSLYVGEQPSSITGGWPNGGNGYNSSYGRAGGGSSDIRIGGTALSNRVMVAGAGGGNGWNCGDEKGGDAGLQNTAGNGLYCSSYNSSYAGGGASQSSIGVGSSYWNSSSTQGAIGQGGHAYSGGNYAGGGGGGYFGGGGGSYYGGGGGGSSYIDPALTSNQNYVSASNVGHGYIKITTNTQYCTSVKVPVNVVVNNIPSPVVTPVAAIDCGDMTTLSVTASSPIIEWFHTPTGGTPFALGNTIQTAPIYTTDTFWVQSKSWLPINGNHTFNYTGSAQTFTVPQDVYEIEIEAAGAQGGSNSWHRGGYGAIVKSKMAVTPGQVIELNVGQQPSSISAGWPDGGSGFSNTTYSRAGGGSTDIRIGGSTLNNRIIVAGAGGGAGYNSSTTDYCRGGDAGLSGTAGNGWYNNSATNSSYCGYGASQSAGGNAGNGYAVPYSGGFGQGGNGHTSSYYPGGGGGGWYGGGGGYYYGGGGGGSSYIDPTATISQNYVSATNTGNGYIKITYNSEEPCVSARIPYVVSVNPIAPTVVIHGDTTFCGSGNATFSIQPVIGATYKWVDQNNNLVGNNTTYNTGTKTSTNSYTVSYILNGCASAPATVTSNINPIPVTGIVNPGTICSSVGTLQLQAASQTGTWSGNGIINSNSGYFDALTSIGQNKVFLTVTDNATGCTAKDSVEFLVLASPDATIITAGQNLCITSSTIALSSVTNGGTWSGVGVNPTTAIFDPVAAGIGTHTVYYSLINSTCNDKDSITFVVAPIPSAAITNAPTSICKASAPITLTSATSGGTWSGAGITNSNTGIFDPSTLNAGSHTVYYSVSVGSCNDQQSVTIIVDSLITPVIANSNTALCEGSAAIQLNASPVGGTWSGTGVNANGLFDPATLGLGSQNIVYSYTSGLCSATDTVTITINAIPTATFTAATFSHCESVASVALIPSVNGGSWSGNGISNPNIANFSPSLAGLGTHVVTYTIVTNGCTATYNQSFVVTSAPTVNITSNVTSTCVNSQAFNMVGIPAGGTWTGNGILNPNSGVFNPTMATVGSHQVVYTYSPNGGCSNTDTITIEVGSIPQANFNTTLACAEELVYLNDLSIDQFGTISSWFWNLGDGNTSTTQNPTHTYTQAGNYIVSLQVQNAQGCSNTIAKPIVIENAPSAAWSYTHIGTNSAKLSPTNPVVGADYLWNLGDGNITTALSPNHVYAMPGTYTVCLTVEKNGCSTTECHEVTAQAYTGIEEVQVLATAPEVFPNPFIHNFNIRLQVTENADVQYKLYDMTGRVILMDKANALTPGSHTLEVQTPNLGLVSGFYNLEILVNGVRYNSILIKQ